MALSLAELIVVCLLVDAVFRRWRMPGLVGMLLAGIALGPYAADWIDPRLAAVSSDLRMIALIVILLRAGFELSRDTLRKVGARALLFSFVPAVFEGAAITALGPRMLGLTWLESALLGSVLAAVSPAVVVPLMIGFMERRKGTAKGIPTMILAAASIDDVFVIVVYSGLIGLYTGERTNLFWKAAGIPVSITLGVAVGLGAGALLFLLFRRFNPRATKRVLAVLGVAILLTALEHRLEGLVPLAALLAVMAVGFVILDRSPPMARELSRKLSKLWVFAEIVLFALVGAQVNVPVAISAGPSVAGLIILGLAARSAGSWVCMIGSDLTTAERMFVIVSYLPKATVQAAIGGAPLLAMKAAGMDTGPGETILAAAALSILLTAPLGAWAIRLVGERVLEEEPLVQAGHADPAAAERDILAAIGVCDVLDPDPAAVLEHQPLRHVLAVFADCQYEALPVVDTRGMFRGLVHLADLKPVLAATEIWQGIIAHDVMRQAPATITDGATLLDAKAALGATAADSLPVVGPGGVFAGMLTRRDLDRFAGEKTVEWLAGRDGRKA